MMCWEYIAIDRLGREQRGMIDGSLAFARRRLIEQHLAIVALSPAFFKKVMSRRPDERIRPLSVKQMILFFKDMANMLEAGLAIHQALLVFQESLADSNTTIFCRCIRDRLAQGASLAESFDIQKAVPLTVIRAIRSAERAGRLPEVLRMLADYYEKILQVRQKITGALIYPLAVMVLLGVVLVYMAVVVVPQVETFLPSSAMKGALTAGLLNVSHVLRTGWWGFLLLMGLITGMFWQRRIKVLNDMLERVLEKLPGIKEIKKDLVMSRAFFTLAVLQRSGIPMDAALRDVMAISRGRTAAAFEGCLSCLLGGLPLSEAMRRDLYFPRFVYDTLSLGEQMGKYDEYTERVYQVFYRSFVTRIDALAELIQPAMLCCCAGCIALISVGLLGPIYGNLVNMGGVLK